MANWYLYMVRCTDDYLYTGITTHPARRFREHCTHSKKRAAFFRAHKPLEMRVIQQFDNRSDVQKEEAATKKKTRSQKRMLYQSGIPLPQFCEAETA